MWSLRDLWYIQAVFWGDFVELKRLHGLGQNSGKYQRKPKKKKELSGEKLRV